MSKSMHITFVLVAMATVHLIMVHSVGLEIIVYGVVISLMGKYPFTGHQLSTQMAYLDSMRKVQVDEWMDGWMNGWIDGWTDG